MTSLRRSNAREFPDSRAVQWLRLDTFIGDLGSIPGRGTKFPQTM